MRRMNTMAQGRKVGIRMVILPFSEHPLQLTAAAATAAAAAAVAIPAVVVELP